MSKVSRSCLLHQHRSYATLAACLWPMNLWVGGDGPYAHLAWCGGLTVILYATLREAVWPTELAAGRYCGAKCGGRHQVIRIELGRAAVAA